ncbi:MAG: hypothetical protein Q9208_001424 [Pyrenodesmia sp. 3 TL-2023]
MNLLVASTSIRSNRGALGFRRTFATRRKPSTRPRSVAIPSTSHSLQQIILPNTWRGRKGLRAAKEFWANGVKKLSGKEPPAGSLENNPLLLYIDRTPTTASNGILWGQANQIRFTKDHPLGQRLWSIAHPVPWSKRCRWVRWPAYIVIGLYSSLFCFWFFCRIQVPITGRWQFQCLPVQSPPLRGSHPQLALSEGAARCLLSPNDPRRVRVRAILARVLLASGLEHLEWTLLVFDVPNIPNAWVHPQGLVMVYTGLFAAAETDDEIAAVLSHEVAHVLAQHAMADRSETLLGSLATLPVQPFALAATLIAELWLIAAPPRILGAMILRARSREREAEADKIGMLLMTEAGFDPSAAVSFWDKMVRLEQKLMKEKGVKQLAEYQSTHPHSESRVEQAALDVPKILYMTGRGPLRPGQSSKELRKLTKEKRLWEEYLRRRPFQALDSVGS